MQANFHIIIKIKNKRTCQIRPLTDRNPPYSLKQKELIKILKQKLESNGSVRFVLSLIGMLPTLKIMR